MNIRAKNLKTIINKLEKKALTSFSRKNYFIKIAVADAVDNLHFYFHHVERLFILTPDAFFYLEDGMGSVSHKHLMTRNVRKINKLNKINFGQNKIEPNALHPQYELTLPQFKKIVSITQHKYLKHSLLKSMRAFYLGLPKKDEEVRMLTHEEEWQLCKLFFSSKDKNHREKKLHSTLHHYLTDGSSHMNIKLGIFKILYQENIFSLDNYKLVVNLPEKFNFNKIRNIINLIKECDFLSNKARPYIKKRNLIFQDHHFWQNLKSLLNQENTNFIIEKKGLLEIASIFLFFSASQILHFFSHERYKEIIQLYFIYDGYISGDQFNQLLQVDIKSFFKIIEKIKICDMDHQCYCFMKLLTKKNIKALLLFLESLSSEKIEEKIICIIKNNDYLLLSKFIAFENKYNVNINLDAVAEDNKVLGFIYYVLDRAEKIGLITQSVINFLIQDIKEIKDICYRLIKFVMSYDVAERELSLQLYEIIKDHSDFLKDPLFLWVEQHKYQSVLEMHKALLVVDDGDGSIPHCYLQKDILKEYARLPFYIYKRNDLLDNIESLCNRLLLSHTDQLVKLIYNYFDLLITKNFIIPYDYDLFSFEYLFKYSTFSQEVFLRKYNKLLDLSPKKNQIAMSRLFKENKSAFYNIFLIFYPQHMELLFKLLSTSVIPLHNIIKKANMPFCYASGQNGLYRFMLHKIGQLNFPSEGIIKELFDYLQIIYDRVNLQPFYYLLIFLDKPDTTAADLLAELRLQIATIFSKQLNVSQNKLITSTIFSFKQISALAYARSNHQCKYMLIFDYLINAHYAGLNVDQLLHDKNQINNTGKQIALNNEINRAALIARGLNLEMLFNYSDKQAFSVYGKKIKLCNEMTISIWQILNELKTQLDSFLKIPDFDIIFKVECQIIQLAQTKIESYIAQINKKLKDQILDETNLAMLTFMQNDANIKLLTNTLQPKLKNISTIVQPALLWTSAWKLIQKNIQNLVEQITNLNTLLVEFNSNNNKECAWKNSRHFNVELWDKTKPLTFFLGNHLGCCLSTDGNQFPAIIQRIIDDALLIMTVIDQASKEAVAGMWLYIAKDKLDDKNYLVANFTEMRSAIARKPLLRDAILAEMLAFAHEYAKKNKLIFVLAKLNYGPLQNQNWVFTKHQHDFEKIGVMSVDGSYNNYYLKSLDNNYFYHYNASQAKIIYSKGQDQVIISHTLSIEKLNLHKIGLFSKKENKPNNAIAHVNHLTP